MNAILARLLTKFVDHYLKPHAETPICYIRDTEDFINETYGAENITEEIFPVTLNVKFLYTNIANC